MAITIIKPKDQKPKESMPVAAELEITELPIEDLADRYGELQDRITALKADPLFAQFEQVEAELKTRLEEFQPSDAMQIKGHRWILEIGPCAKTPRKIIDLAAVLKFLGVGTFLKIAKVGVSDAEKYLTPQQFESVVSEESYTKNRKITPKFLG